MDTSRGTTEGNLALLLDRSSVPIAEIGDEAWMKVIHAYRNELPLKWMRGFRTISDHLECKRTDVAVERKLAKKVNVLSSTVTARSGETYLNCLDVCSKFPRTWQEAPRATRFRGVGALVEQLEELRTQHILLSRKSIFYEIDVLWRPIEGWGSDLRHVFFYEAYEIVLRHIRTNERMIELFDLARLRGDNEHPAETVVQRFLQAMNETASNVRGQYDFAVKIATRMQNTLERIAR